MIENHLPIIIIIAPLIASLAIGLLVRGSASLSSFILIVALICSFLASCTVLLQVMESGVAVHYFLGSWQPPYGIELVIDHLSSMVLVLVSGCALLTAVYSLPEVSKELPDRTHHYYSLYALLVSGLLGIVSSGDVFNLYVLLEISALASYALLAGGRGLAYISTFKYIMVGTIGASFYLFGVAYIYIKTGSLNIADLGVMLATPELTESISIKIGFVLIIIGVWVKMAFFPLHGWLPNAYTYASSTTSCLIAPLMTKVSVYIMIRMMFTVFSADYIFQTLEYGAIVMAMACAAILFGSITALAQKDLKRMLCYIVIAEIGYMVGGIWMADGAGFTGAVYHILADAVMTLCMFMVIGAVIHTTGKSSLDAMRGIFRKMPITGVVFLVGAAALIGVPPTCGFFSKWFLLSGAMSAEQWFFAGSLIISSLINAVIFFRLIEIGFFPSFNEGESGTHHEVVVVKEAPVAMLIPMVITAALLLLIGIYAGEISSNMIRWTIPAGL
jgi:multicomponent Na+:H+ antiporter subunit D